MQKVPTSGRDVFIRSKTSAGCSRAPGTWMIHDNFSNRMAFAPAMVHSNFCPINFRWYGSGLPWLQRVTEN